MQDMFISVIIPAAGQSRRMQSAINKQYLSVKGRPLLYYTLKPFEAIKSINEIIVVTGKREQAFCKKNVIDRYRFKKVKTVVGGSTRQASVYAGLKATDKRCRIVVIHDGARPLVTEKIIMDSIEATKKHKATIVAVPAKNTIKMIKRGNIVDYTPNRNLMIEVQTPQTFDYGLIRRAHEKGLEEGTVATDDAFLLERLGYPIKIVRGHYNNIKITTPEDLLVLEAMIDLKAKR